MLLGEKIVAALVNSATMNHLILDTTGNTYRAINCGNACPCGHTSQTKEVTRCYQLSEAKMEEPNVECAKNILYTVDQPSFEK